MASEWKATECDNCGETALTVRDRDNGNAECDTCWRDSLAFGHFHGLHEEPVDGCPTCGGHTPEAYRTDPEACPTCGAMPGDGVTAWCNDATGCGFWKDAR
jgi:hypothetical protein